MICQRSISQALSYSISAALPSPSAPPLPLGHRFHPALRELATSREFEPRPAGNACSFGPGVLYAPLPGYTGQGALRRSAPQDAQQALATYGIEFGAAEVFRERNLQKFWSLGGSSLSSLDNLPLSATPSFSYTLRK